jgi:hypothetical protein
LAAAFRPLWLVFLLRPSVAFSEGGPVIFKLHRSFHTVETFISGYYKYINYYKVISSFTIFQLAGSEPVRPDSSGRAKTVTQATGEPLCGSELNEIPGNRDELTGESLRGSELNESRVIGMS